LISDELYQNFIMSKISNQKLLHHYNKHRVHVIIILNDFIINPIGNNSSIQAVNNSNKSKNAEGNFSENSAFSVILLRGLKKLRKVYQ
jgi:hypothetical protein